ncbi:hypothetical protein Desru_1828 [Desulforamulus ruminis DSM 2154]|uniref:Uncharacterized protein n=1 Tax=Desulforamulus ruminis (strain ATCC 23193 / DSM 2154 / NCIMB 8452 / DL) TaxID=696281 RepID=F6DU16_DESRL|nr:hypothetical protein Desru_1828 [Desulforamulus ruminis DSM 2154]
MKPGNRSALVDKVLIPSGSISWQMGGSGTQNEQPLHPLKGFNFLRRLHHDREKTWF